MTGDSSASSSVDLTGQFLIAMPGMGDPRFDKSVIFMCAHSGEGAMGLIVNKPAVEVRFQDLLDQLDLKAPAHTANVPVHFGGPVEQARGFVLHSTEYVANESTLDVTSEIGMTATLDVLEDIAQANGPSKSLLALGYSGWAAGQLEAELAANAWLTAPASPQIVFETADEAKWQAALGVLGVDALVLSDTAGRA